MVSLLSQLQDQAHSAAIKFERAHSEYESAKETLRIAEQGIADLEQERKNTRQDRAKSPVCQIDEAWQETLSNATDRVSRACNKYMYMYMYAVYACTRSF